MPDSLPIGVAYRDPEILAGKIDATPIGGDIPDAGAFTTVKVGSYTTSEMNAIPSPANGIIIYNTTENSFYGYQNGAWAALGTGGGGGGGNSYYYNLSLIHI